LARPSVAAEAVREHALAVYRYLARRLPPSDVDDAVQETFLALVQAEAAHVPIEDPGAWLLVVARRRAADRLRSRARTPVALPEGWEAFAHERLPDEVLAHAELRALVHVALGLLPAAARALLLARYREGLPTAELARREGASEKAIELRLRRARAAFEERFLVVGRDWTSTLETPS
jgi:RNA polymerase sigma-70 factor (ECF subfamily)